MKHLLFAILIVVSYGAKAQNTGYYGKKNYFDFSVHGNFRIFSIFFEDGNYLKRTSKVSDNLVQKKDIFDFGFRGSYNRMIKNNLAIGIEAGLDFQNTAMEYSFYEFYPQGSEYSYSIQVDYETLKMRTFSIMPKITFCSSGSLLPIGISHEIGVGYNGTKIVKDDYVYEIPDNWTSSELTAADSSKIENNYVDYDKNFSSVTLLYGLKFRTPLTKSLLLNYGFRYTLNIGNFRSETPHNSSYVIDNDDLANRIATTRIFNFITFNIGLSIAL